MSKKEAGGEGDKARANQAAVKARGWGNLLRRELKGADFAVRHRRACELWDATKGRQSQKGALELAVRAGMADLLGPLVKMGANPNERYAGRNGSLALHSAVGLKDEAEQREIIGILLDNGARADSWMGQPLSAVVCALCAGSASGLKILSERGVAMSPAGKNEERERFTDLPRWVDDSALASALPSWVALGGDPNVEDSYGNTLLIRALQCSKKETARALLACGASPDALPGSRMRPIRIAQTYGGVGLLRVVLEAGADPNASGAGEGSPLAEEIIFALNCHDFDLQGSPGRDQRGAAMCAALLDHGARLGDPAPERYGAGMSVADLARTGDPKGSIGREAAALILARAQAEELERSMPAGARSAKARGI